MNFIFLISFLVLTSFNVLAEQKKQMSSQKHIFKCYSESGLLLEVESIESGDHLTVCKNKNLLAYPPTIERKSNKHFYYNLHGEYKHAKHDLSKCKYISSELKSEQVVNGKIDYTEMVYSCGDGQKTKTTKVYCEGKLVGNPEKCLDNSINLLTLHTKSKHKHNSISTFPKVKTPIKLPK